MSLSVRNQWDGPPRFHCPRVEGQNAGVFRFDKEQTMEKVTDSHRLGQEGVPRDGRGRRGIGGGVQAVPARRTTVVRGAAAARRQKRVRDVDDDAVLGAVALERESLVFEPQRLPGRHEARGAGRDVEFRDPRRVRRRSAPPRQSEFPPPPAGPRAPPEPADPRERRVAFHEVALRDQERRNHAGPGRGGAGHADLGASQPTAPAFLA